VERRINRIQSPSNPEIKQIAALHRTKERNETGLFLIEGPHLLKEALDSKLAKIERIYVTERYAQTKEGSQCLQSAARRGIVLTELSEQAFGKAAETETPQGVLAVAAQPKIGLPDLPANQMILFLDRVQDPGNVGTIIRTAAAAGAGGVIVAEGGVDPFSGKVVRASQGAIFSLPVVARVPVSDAVEWAARKGLPVICTSPHSGEVYYQIDLSGAGLLVLGHESQGVSAEMTKAANKLVRIPIIGRAESLNVAIAAAVLLFEAARQRTQG
jgi:TrmH family RNA methyltransferase